MGRIYELEGIYLYMYPPEAENQHHVPHIHAWNSGAWIVIELQDCTIRNDSREFNHGKKKRLLKWVWANREWLLEQWEKNR